MGVSKKEFIKALSVVKQYCIESEETYNLTKNINKTISSFVKKANEENTYLTNIDMPLEDMGLSPRLYNIIKTNKCNTIREFYEKNYPDFLKVKGFGYAGYKELKPVLIIAGLDSN